MKHGCLPRKEGFQDLWNRHASMTVWPSGLRRWLKAPFRKGVGSNPTGVTFSGEFVRLCGQCLVVWLLLSLLQVSLAFHLSMFH